MGTPASLLVVGLGNPGSEYARTRHNAGADVVAILAERHNGSLKNNKKERALVADLKIDANLVIVAFPQTYMNDSGLSVAPLSKRAALKEWAQLVVVHDELDLPLGGLKVKVGGGLAGHNGLRSITAHLKTQEYTRVRIGIGKPPGGKDNGADHVLKKLGSKDDELLRAVEEQAADAVELILKSGVQAAMTQYNG